MSLLLNRLHHDLLDTHAEQCFGPPSPRRRQVAERKGWLARSAPPEEEWGVPSPERNLEDYQEREGDVEDTFPAILETKLDFTTNCVSGRAGRRALQSGERQQVGKRLAVVVAL